MRFAVRPARARSSALEEHFQRPLHRARPALRDHRVASVDVRRRSDRAEQSAADVRALRRAKIDAVEEVEDLPSGLNPGVPLKMELLDDVHIQLRESRLPGAVATAIPE